jgi:hypothetical protein
MGGHDFGSEVLTQISYVECGPSPSPDEPSPSPSPDEPSPSPSPDPSCGAACTQVVHAIVSGGVHEPGAANPLCAAVADAAECQRRCGEAEHGVTLAYKEACAGIYD